MKLTNENINEYFTLDLKILENGPMLPNVLIRPKGYPPINTPFSIEEYNKLFGDSDNVRLSLSETGILNITDGIISTPIGLTIDSLEALV